MGNKRENHCFNPSGPVLELCCWDFFWRATCNKIGRSCSLLNVCVQLWARDVAVFWVGPLLGLICCFFLLLYGQCFSTLVSQAGSRGKGLLLSLWGIISWSAKKRTMEKVGALRLQLWVSGLGPGCRVAQDSTSTIAALLRPLLGTTPVSAVWVTWDGGVLDVHLQLWRLGLRVGSTLEVHRRLRGGMQAEEEVDGLRITRTHVVVDLVDGVSCSIPRKTFLTWVHGYLANPSRPVVKRAEPPAAPVKAAASSSVSLASLDRALSAAPVETPPCHRSRRAQQRRGHRLDLRSPGNLVVSLAGLRRPRCCRPGLPSRALPGGLKCTLEISCCCAGFP